MKLQREQGEWEIAPKGTVKPEKQIALPELPCTGVAGSFRFSCYTVIGARRSHNGLGGLGKYFGEIGKRLRVGETTLLCVAERVSNVMIAEKTERKFSSGAEAPGLLKK